MKDLIDNITLWANERNLILGTTPKTQGLALLSNYGELCDSIAKQNLVGIKHSIGKIMLVSIIIANQYKQRIDLNSLTIITDTSSINNLGHQLLYLIKDLEYVDIVLHNLQGIAKRYNLNLKECLDYAYNQIKD